MSKEELEELCYQLYMVGNTDALKGIIRGRDQVMVIFNERLKTLTKTKPKMSKEEVVEMLVYFAEQYPDMLSKHMEDDDLGEGAFTEFVEEYINREKDE